MNEKIKLAEDTIDKIELENLSKWILNASQLTKGPLTIEFEKAFSEYIGCKYSVFVNSGSSANLVMFYALKEMGKLKNNKVIVPSVSWITTLSPAIQLGFEPILCDVNQNNLGVDLNHLEEICKNHRPSLLILVHVLGHINDMEQIHKICQKYEVEVIEDACEALGSSYKDGVKAGNLSLAGSFSFYYGHHISTIEGGMVTTNNRELYNIILSIRSHGWSRDIENEFKIEWMKDYDIDEFRNFYTFYYPGFNLRSSDLNAFLGLSQLKKMDNIVEVRSKNFDTYKKYISEKFWSQKSDSAKLSSFAYGTFVKNRLEVFQMLKKNNIESRPLICGSMGRQPFWIKKYGELSLPISDKVHFNGIYLPNHAHLNDEQIRNVAEVFNNVAEPI